jgi:hypothetical protein
MSRIKTYICGRAMTDNGRDYARGEAIEMATADAATLLSLGALIDDAPEDDDGNGPIVDLEKQNVEQLKELAKTEAVDLEGITKKADIVAAIKLKRENA